MNSKEKEFRAMHKVLHEFEHNGMKYVLYRLNESYPPILVSGDQFEWGFGYEWSKTLRNVVEVFNVEDPVKRKIETYLQ